MPRRRGFTDLEVARAAKQVFWDRGYGGTAIDDLQVATGLSRSSLYLAFGGKRAVFDAAIADYVTSFIDPLVGPLEAPEAGLREAADYFRSLADYFGLPEAHRGCLMVNSMAELAGRDPSFSRSAADFVRRLRTAFGNALGNAAADGAMDPKQASRRTALLAASVVGVWIAVRTDATAAAATCLTVAQEISSWGSLPAG